MLDYMKHSLERDKDRYRRDEARIPQKRRQWTRTRTSFEEDISLTTATYGYETYMKGQGNMTFPEDTNIARFR